MKIVQYVKSSYQELVHKVSWPTWPELLNSAVIVMVASLIFALLILAMDQVSESLMTAIYNQLY